MKNVLDWLINCFIHECRLLPLQNTNIWSVMNIATTDSHEHRIWDPMKHHHMFSHDRKPRRKGPASFSATRWLLPIDPLYHARVKEIGRSLRIPHTLVRPTCAQMRNLTGFVLLLADGSASAWAEVPNVLNLLLFFIVGTLLFFIARTHHLNDALAGKT